MWDELNVVLRCQSVRQDMMFLALNSLQNLGGKKLSRPYIITQDICNKVMKIKFSVGFMGWLWC